MYILYNNSIHIFDTNNINHNMLFLKLKTKYPTFSVDTLNSIINMYNSIESNKCTYDPLIEQKIKTYCQDL